MATPHRLIAIPILLLVLCAASCAPPASARERVVGSPCEGCDAVFIGMPKVAGMKSEARIAPDGEPGAALRVDGLVSNAAGKPASGIVVYAYQTNTKGIYPHDERFKGTSAYRHGKLRGWARSDVSGRYTFTTIRPASYPDSDIPQHIHLHVLEPGRCTYWIDDLVFTDDTFLTAEQRAGHEHGRGGIGTATPARDADGTWRVRRDIRLGAGIADYPK